MEVVAARRPHDPDALLAQNGLADLRGVYCIRTCHEERLKADAAL